MGSFIGLVLGLVGAVALGIGAYRGTLRFNMRKFFAISGSALLIVVADILLNGIKDLQEVNWLPNINNLGVIVAAIYLIIALPNYLKPASKKVTKEETLVHTA